MRESQPDVWNGLSKEATPPMQEIVANPTAVEPCHYSVEITVPAEQVDTVFNQMLRQFRNQARVPGFRPGKTPEKLVRRKFAGEIKEEATRQLIQEGFQSALQKAEAKPITMPTLAGNAEPEASEGEPFVFTIEYDVEPQFEVPQYKELELNRPKVEVTDDMVTEFIDNMREQHANYDTVDRAAETGDMLKVTYSTDVPEEEEVPVAAQQLLNCEETWLILSDPEYLPGANEQLTGAAAGDEKSVEVTFPDDYHVDYLQGKSYTYQVTVHEVHGQVKPELTDDLAKTFGAESVEDLLKSVREYLDNQVQQNQQQALEGQIYEKLDELDDFDLPPQVLENEERMALRNRLNQLQREGADQEALMGQIEELQQNAKDQARTRLKMRYIMEKIAEAEDISVSDQEVQSYVQSFQQQTGLTDAQFEKQFDANLVADQGRQSMLSTRVMGLILESATITDITPEEAKAAGETQDEADEQEDDSDES